MTNDDYDATLIIYKSALIDKIIALSFPLSKFCSPKTATFFEFLNNFIVCWQKLTNFSLSSNGNRIEGVQKEVRIHGQSNFGLFYV